MSAKHSKDYGEDYRMGQSQKYHSNSQSKKRNINDKQPKNKKNRSKVNIFFKVMAFIYLVITIVFYISVVKMDLLPTLYITIFSIAEIIFTFIMMVGLAKKHRTYKLNIFCLIIAIVISLVYIYVTNYANATSNFLDTVFVEVEETEDYYIVVRKNDTYSEIKDVANKDVYLFNVEDDVKQDIGSKVNITLKVSESLSELGEKLLGNKIDVILLSSAQYNILGDEIEDFKDNTKIIYTSMHKIEKTEEDIKVEEKKYTIQDGIFHVYISGIDTSGRISNVSRSDANIIVTINTKTHEILLTSIPRDYYVTLHSKHAKDKLTHSGIYGVNETVTTVEDLLDLDINYYVRVNFTTLIKLVDTLGGVDVYSDYNFSRNGYHFSQGYNHLNGSAALVFSRERYSFAGGDNQRVKNQQHVIEAIMKKVLNSKTILTKYTSLLNTMKGSFQTNIEQSEISSLVKSQLQDMSSWKIKSNSLTGAGASKSTYSMGSQLLYVMIPNTESVNNAKSKIADVMGEQN